MMIAPDRYRARKTGIWHSSKIEAVTPPNIRSLGLRGHFCNNTR